jgi:hypothetical protein
VGVEIEYVRSQSLVPPSVRVLLGRMPRTTTAYPSRVQPSPCEGEGAKLSRLQAAHGFIGPFEGLTQ